MKRFLSFFLIFMLLFAILSACGSEAPTLLPFISEVSDEKDFGGMVFRVLSEASPGVGLDYVAEGESPSVRKEMFISRMAEIEKKYNCDIEFNGDNEANYPMYYISGIDRADLLQYRIRFAYDLYHEDYFIPITDIPYVDISDGKYGTEDFIESFTWNGDLIGSWPVHWGYTFTGFSDGMYYNPVIFTEIGQPTPNERYEQGDWTWDSLREISDACQSIATGDNPKYLTVLNNYFPRILIRSNGGEFVRKGSDGKYSYGLNSPEVIEALQFANDLLNEGAINPSGTEHTAVTADFGKGRYAIMCEYDVYYDTYIMNMDTGVGVCYPPMGPKATEFVTTGLMSIENSLYFVTREKSEDIESLGQFMEIFYQPIDGSTEDWKYEYVNMNFLDETSGEVFLSKMINKDFDNVIFAFTNDTLFYAVLDGAKYGSIAENIQKYQQAVNSKLDSSINTWND